MKNLSINFLKDGILKEGGTNYLNINFKIENKEIIQKENKKNNLFLFVIDNSASMKGHASDKNMSKIDFAKKAITSFVDWLDSKDKIGIVAFNSNTEIIQMPIELTNKNEIFENINNIIPKGCTNMGEGLEVARELISKSDLVNYNCKIILLSDGDINEGKSEDELIQLSIKYLESGISLSSLGVGNEYNSKLMNDISTSLFYHVTSLKILENILQEELSLNNRILYNNAKLKIKFDGLIEVMENLNDLKETIIGDEKVLYIGNILNGKEKNIYIELKNDLEKEDVVFEVTLELDKENSISQKKTLKIVNKEELEKLVENIDILNSVATILKRKAIQDTSLEYMNSRDMNSVKNTITSYSKKINDLNDSLSLSSNAGYILSNCIQEASVCTTSYSSSNENYVKNLYCSNSSKSLLNN